MRKLLHFAQDGDTSGFFPQLGRWHDPSRYRMHFATLRPMEPGLRATMTSRGIPTFSCGCRSRLTYPLGVIRLARYLRRERIEVLHAHLFDPSLVGLGAAVLARTPLRVLTRHYSDYHTRIDKQWHIRLDRLAGKLSHAVIAVSEHTADHLRRQEGLAPTKVVTVPNGIDFDRARVSSPDAPARLRTELALAGRHSILVAARLHPEKGYEHLFAALPLLRERLEGRLVLLVAGEGLLLEHYRALVTRLGCQDLVRFLGFRHDLPDLMVAADVFVLPSVAEAFGLVLAEALFLGTPVVATRVGGIPEVVEHDVDGLLVPPGDPDALADALARILSDDVLRRRLAGAGRARVETRFRFEDMVRRYEALYDQHWAAPECRRA